MSYSVKEIFHTLQGEGANTGRAAVFCRFAGCNLWSGHERDRSSARCRFCDTDFVGVNGERGGRYATADELAQTVEDTWQGPAERRFVVCTGGEPLLQLDQPLVDALRGLGFSVAIETNGTVRPKADVDWTCVSPKAGTELMLLSGNELKLVYPQQGISPGDFLDLDFDHFFLQPLDGENLARNLHVAVEYCLANPAWRLSLQAHKLIGIR